MTNKKINLKGVKPATWVRIISLTLVLVNLVATSVFDVQIVPFEDEQIYNGVSSAVTAIVAVITGYKNNSVTTEAQEADEVLKEKKKGGK